MNLFVTVFVGVCLFVMWFVGVVALASAADSARDLRAKAMYFIVGVTVFAAGLGMAVAWAEHELPTTHAEQPR